ncbi:MAG TPA: cation diffusion facilitator family transporter [Gemmataceae bacterium]|nr:cation diffusion facilitator family transporter [Gemmataceae bacterium]
MPSGPSTMTVLASVAGTSAITIVKFVAAGFSGSAAMLAEGVHSSVDTINSLLLYLGLRRSQKPADETHPFGYGLELYFWTLVVALLMFAVGGGLTIAEGIYHVLQPEELGSVGWSYTVLGLCMAFNGFTWAVAVKQFWVSKGNQGFWQAVRKAKDPTILTVLFEDSASLVGLVIAFLGIFLTRFFDLPALDGIASILIGVLLGGVAIGLVYQSKTLLAGESANEETVQSIRKLVQSDNAVEKIENLLTMHLSPEEILLNLKIRFRDGLPIRAVGEAVDRLEERLRAEHPELKRIFIEPGPLTAADANGAEWR